MLLPEWSLMLSCALAPLGEPVDISFSDAVARADRIVRGEVVAAERESIATPWGENAPWWRVEIAVEQCLKGPARERSIEVFAFAEASNASEDSVLGTRGIFLLADARQYGVAWRLAWAARPISATETPHVPIGRLLCAFPATWVDGCEWIESRGVEMPRADAADAALRPIGDFERDVLQLVELQARPLVTLRPVVPVGQSAWTLVLARDGSIVVDALGDAGAPARTTAKIYFRGRIQDALAEFEPSAHVRLRLPNATEQTLRAVWHSRDGSIVFDVSLDPRARLDETRTDPPAKLWSALVDSLPLSELPAALVEALGGRPPAWSKRSAMTPSYGPGR